MDTELKHVTYCNTTISLEPAFVECLNEIAAARGIPQFKLLVIIDELNPDAPNLSSAVRTYIVEYYRARMLERNADAGLN